MTQTLFLNNCKKILPALAALLFISFTLLAQQQPLSLNDALKYALKNKAEAQKAKLDMKMHNTGLMKPKQVHCLS